MGKVNTSRASRVSNRYTTALEICRECKSTLWDAINELENKELNLEDENSNDLPFSLTIMYGDYAETFKFISVKVTEFDEIYFYGEYVDMGEEAELEWDDFNLGDRFTIAEVILSYLAEKEKTNE